jgi:hypothetical protein
MHSGSTNMRPSRPRRLLVERLEDRSVPAFLAPLEVGATGGKPLAADFNNDGVPDLVTVSASTASVRLGNGDGTFGAPILSPVSGDPRSLTAGDFDRDGNVDLVTSQYGGTTPGRRLRLLRGNGDGTFQTQQRFALPAVDGVLQRPISVASGDLNRDGRLDLVVTADGQAFSSATTQLLRANVNVLLGRGDGTFRAAGKRQLINAHLAGRFLPIVLGDFNRDARLDVLVGDGDNFRSRFVTLLPSVFLLLGSGSGGLGVANRVGQPGASLTSLAAGDFNRDGNLDFVTTNAATSTVNVVLGNGNGTFRSVRNFATGNLPTGVVVADFNRDGRPDLATTSGASGFAAAGVSVLLGNGDGTFRPMRNFDAGAALTDPVAADLDGDGFADLVTRRGSSLHVLINDGIWRFA